jgi:hypothetical protein
MRATTTSRISKLFQFPTSVAFLHRLSWGRVFVWLLIVAVSSGEIANASGLKPGPHGIFALLPSFNSDRRVNLSRPVWSNPVVRGVRVRTVWRNLQPEENRFDWSYLNEAVALAARHGKSVGVSVAAGISTPDWVYRGGAERFDFTLTTPAGFQMVWSTEGDEGAKRVKGTLGQALARGAEFNAQFVEVYEVDCQNPAYAGDLREARQRLAPEKRQPAR